MGNKVIKSVSFNVTVLDDKAMLKYVTRKNFSGYVKKLIIADMKLKGVEVVEVVTVDKPVIPSPREQLENLKRKKSESRPAQPMINLPKN